MSSVEVFTDEDEAEAWFVADFDFLPRKGEYLTLDVDDELLQYEVVEVWHRQGDEEGTFSACIRVEMGE